MKPGEKEVNTLLRNEVARLKGEERSFVFVFLQTPIRSRSPLLTGSRLISLPLATKMFQFAKFEKSKERRLATELGYGFPIGDPWITDGISPWPFASESVLPSQCPGIHPMHSFRSCTLCRLAKHRLDKRYTSHQPNLDEKKEKQTGWDRPSIPVNNVPLIRRGQDSNLQSSGHEPDELTNSSTPLLPLLFRTPKTKVRLACVKHIV
ncbi:hypothetical protein KY290_029691 [Solanum tuberosum]|uniref:Mitochondrial protein n=2 Tax=Solanum TaxID=4107 RepID=A0ABQ7UN50_SOLTU|nr:hypothetical protein KY284_037364 [Solanum tuberosum]KAH0637744.1 hypothetical protein KY289_037659 [Solanum tuberosum]KAH0697729.1 hypothetical protein KY289_015211 [Solanum tuberosum]KAH0709838.1 hypothetical protein KY284_011265 [Solanum tuberosum]KAH0713241.1 hypothetical protein KY289_009200 [Solanum tuberosum]